MEPTKEEVTESLQAFKSRRDDVLHEDDSVFEHHLDAFVQFCENDPVAAPILEDAQRSKPDFDEWWNATFSEDQRKPDLKFPNNPDQNLALRFEVLRFATKQQG